MGSSKDNNTHKSNLMYFNQMVEEKGPIKRHNNARKRKGPNSFATQKVDFKDYLVAPDGYESVVYPIYFVGVPYITGAIVLFFFVAGGSFENFKLIEFNNFLVVWIIGYEIVATVLLVAILVAFLKYDDNDAVKDRHF